MISYPIIYGDNLKEGDSFTSETIIYGSVKYWHDKKIKRILLKVINSVCWF